MQQRKNVNARLEKKLNFYASHHQKNITKITHVIGVPMVILAIQIFLNRFHVYQLSFAWLLFIILSTYYFFLDARLALITTVFLFFLTGFSQYLSANLNSTNAIIVASTLFILGWTLQFVGHYYEGKPPAFSKNILQVLMAPMFLAAELFKL